MVKQPGNNEMKEHYIRMVKQLRNKRDSLQLTQGQTKETLWWECPSTNVFPLTIFSYICLQYADDY